MAADQIFVLLLVLACVVGLTVMEVRSRRRHKAERAAAMNASPASVAEATIAQAAGAERPSRRRTR